MVELREEAESNIYVMLSVKTTVGDGVAIGVNSFWRVGLQFFQVVLIIMGNISGGGMI